MNVETLFHSHQLNHLCKKYHIKRLSFFGSVLREDFNEQSDIDVLVEFDSGHIPGLDFFLIENELSKLLGRKVDLQTPNFLSPEFRQSVIMEAVAAYEQT